MAERFDVAAFRNWLKGIYDADPSGPGAAAIATIVSAVYERADEARRRITPDEFMQRALVTWDKDADGFEARRQWYRAELEAGRFQPVADGILHGFWPMTIPRAAQRGMRHEEGSPVFVGQADAYLVASLANQIFDLIGEDEYLGNQPAAQVFREALTWTVTQLEEAPEGEEPTVRDKVEEAAGDAWDATKGAVTTAAAVVASTFGWGFLAPVGIGVGVVLAGWLIWRKYV